MASAFSNPLTKESLELELKENPESRSALYNLGLLNYLDKHYEESIFHWVNFKALEPHDWQLRAKLIQAYSANGNKEERENEILELVSLRESGKYPELSKARFFVRDQFQVKQIKVFVFDYYDMDAEWYMGPLVWKFYLMKDDDPMNKFISLGSYDETTEYIRSKGDIKSDERAYHLDGYWQDGTHSTYGIYLSKPDYDWTKENVIKILNGEIDEISSSQPVRE